MGWKVLIGVFLLGLVAFAGEENRLRTIEKGAFSGFQEPLQTVATNKAQWAELWDKHNAQKVPKTAPPEINFDTESVVVISLGRKNTGGYSVEITGVRTSGDSTEVLYTTHEPKPGGFNIQAITAPYHIVAAPRISGEVKFKQADKKGA